MPHFYDGQQRPYLSEIPIRQLTPGDEIVDVKSMTNKNVTGIVLELLEAPIPMFKRDRARLQWDNHWENELVNLDKCSDIVWLGPLTADNIS